MQKRLIENCSGGYELLCIFTHIAAGALVGAFSPSLYLAPVLGLGSHVFLDIVPHYDFEDMKLDKITDEQEIFPGHGRFIPHGRVAGHLNLVMQFVFSIAVVFYLTWRAA